MKPFRWSKPSELAAQRVAEDRLTNAKIAEEAGVTFQTLHNWKCHPDFAARVESHLDEYRAIVRREGIAILEKRVEALNDRWERMRQIMEERGESPDMQDVAGGRTGLLVRTIKGVGSGEDFTLVNQYEVDGTLLKELRDHEKQAAQELGQWAERTTTESMVKLYGGFDPEQV